MYYAGANINRQTKVFWKTINKTKKNMANIDRYHGDEMRLIHVHVASTRSPFWCAS